MILHNVKQGSPEWLTLRSGIPTASAFDQILTPGGKDGKNPKPSASAEKYMYSLLAERIMHHPIEEFISTWMARGSQQEANAVAFYELQADADTVPVGFCTNDAGTIGASPDRLVGDTGLLEIKVPSESIHMGYLLKSGSPYEKYRVQVQGQLWITGREWSDVLSWHPELPPALNRIYRDDAFIKLLSATVEAFSEELERMSAECAAKGWMEPREAPPAFSAEVDQAFAEWEKSNAQ